MIVHVIVPILRHSLSPEKIAAHMNDMLDPSRDQVTVVTVTTSDGDAMETWTVEGS